MSDDIILKIRYFNKRGAFFSVLVLVPIVSIHVIGVFWYSGPTTDSPKTLILVLLLMFSLLLFIQIVQIVEGVIYKKYITMTDKYIDAPGAFFQSNKRVYFDEIKSIRLQGQGMVFPSIIPHRGIYDINIEYLWGKLSIPSSQLENFDMFEKLYEEVKKRTQIK